MSTTPSTRPSSAISGRPSRRSPASRPRSFGRWSWPVMGRRSARAPTSTGCAPRWPLDTEGNEQDAMAMADMFEAIDTCPVPVVARVHGAALGGGMGLLAVSDVVIAESGTRFGFTETRLGILPSVISPFVVAKIGETPRPGAVPGRAAVRCHACGPDRAGPRDRRRRGGARPSRRWGGRGPAGVRTDRDASGQGDRPRGPRSGPRLVQVAHGAGHRATAHERGGPGGLPGVHREAASRLGTRSGRCLTQDRRRKAARNEKALGSDASGADPVTERTRDPERRPARS